MKPSRFVPLACLATAVWACASLAPRPTPGPLPGTGTRPGDFHVRYDWQEGSLPPPYHYETSVDVASDGQATVTMIPGYPSGDVPVWTETFSLDGATLDALYQALLQHGAFTTGWTQQDDPPVGGSLWSLTATANGQTIEIPPYVVESQAEAAGDIASAVTRLVPQSVWDRLNARRDEYVAEQ